MYNSDADGERIKRKERRKQRIKDKYRRDKKDIYKSQKKKKQLDWKECDEYLYSE
jgi:hypothetical protein